MSKRTYFFLFYLISIFIFSTCASISEGGGPKDLSPPILLSSKIYPKSTLNIEPYQKIILPFNERLNPSTAISAISIEPEINILIKIKK